MSLILIATVTALQAAPPAFVPDARFGLALYCPETCDDERIQAIEAALDPIPTRRRMPRAAGEPMRTMGLLTADDFGRPHLDTLGGLSDGLGADAAGVLESSREVLVVSFAAPPERVNELLTTAYPAFLAALESGGGVVEDLTTGRLFDAPGFAVQAGRVTAVPIDTSAFFVLQATGDSDEDTTDLETVGLRALGLHDMRAESLTESQLDDWAALINATAQISWEQGGLRGRTFVAETTIEFPSARLRAVGIEGTVYAMNANSSWSTSVDPLVVLGFDGRFNAAPAFPLDSYPTEMVDGPEPVPEPEVVPEPEPEVVPEVVPEVEVEPVPVPVPEVEPVPTPPVEVHAPPPPTPTLIEIQTRALVNLDGPVRQAWDTGLSSGDRLYVKAPFHGQDGAIEYLWVQVVSWRSAAIDGVLRSEPAWVSELAAGDVVEVDQGVVFDYLWRHSDGSSEGNETEAFLP